jgi:hypothetical protein
MYVQCWKWSVLVFEHVAPQRRERRTTKLLASTKQLSVQKPIRLASRRSLQDGIVNRKNKRKVVLLAWWIKKEAERLLG